MSTDAYRRWVERKRPFKKARPIADVEKWARANGVGVLGTIGDNAHLTSKHPQDHTPFSFTAWPVRLPIDGDEYWVCAIDLRDEPGVADAILAGARAGAMPWLKYANLNGRHYEHDDDFQDSTDSSDEHIHLSARTDHLRTALAADWINHSPGGPKPSEPGEGKPAPGPDVAFPLDAGHWFGKDDGTPRSHSGLHGRKSDGKLDATWIKTWASQLGKRGWPIGKGKRWLSNHGNDGKFGDEYAALVRAFQGDQGLGRDEQLGPRTWNQAFDAPIS